MNTIYSYKIIRTNKVLHNSETILGSVNHITKEIHIKKMTITVLKVRISNKEVKSIDFKTVNKVEKFLLYHEIRHIENRNSMRYLSFRTQNENELDCNLFSLNRLGIKGGSYEVG